MNILKKRSISASLVFVLIMALILSMNVFVGGSDPVSAAIQGPQIGKYTEHGAIKADGTVNNPNITEPALLTRAGLEEELEDDLYVKYSKSIANGPTDGQYEITLNVETNEQVEEMYVPSNIVIVFDMSDSMGYEVTLKDGSKTTRWEIFSKAMAKFIQKFLSEDPQGRNNVAIALFAGRENGRNGSVNDSRILQEWTSSAATAIGSFSGSGKKFDNVRGDVGRYTNGVEAFNAATKILTKGAIGNQHTSVIVMSDGIFNTGTGVANSSNSNSSTPDIQRASITSAGILKGLPGCDDLYTFCLGTDAQKNPAMRLPLAGEAYDSGTGDTNPNGNPHLTKQFNADSEEDIELAFNSIEYEIQKAVQCWNVTDPMSDWVNFIDGSIELNNPASNSAIKLVQTGGGIIEWDLYSHIPVYDEEAGTYTYTLKYLITPDTSLENFPYDKWFATNKQTTLSFLYSSDINNENPSDSGQRIENFLIPTLKIPDPTPREDIKISKKVTGTTDRSQEFKFIVTIGGEAYANSKYYVGGSEETTDEYGNITLRGDQTATIKDLKVGTAVTVTETDPGAYYEISGNAAKNLLVSESGGNSLEFTNVYQSPTSIAGIKSSVPGTEVPVWKTDPITYTIQIKNNDTTTAYGIIVRDDIPDYTTFDSVPSDYSGTHLGTAPYDYVAWYIPELAAGDSVEVTFDVKVNDEFSLGKTIDNIAYFDVTGEEEPESLEGVNPQTPTNELTHYPPSPIMEITKSNTPGNGELVGQGEEIEYQINVANTGKVPLENVWVKDYIPTYTTYKDGSASDNGSYDSTGNFVQWLISEIAAGESATVKFTVIVNDDASDVTITNVALAEILGEDQGIPEERDPVRESNEVTNITPIVEGEVVNPPEDPEVLGEEAYQQTVLGEEAKTADTANPMPYLILLVLITLAVFAGTVFRMSRAKK